MCRPCVWPSGVLIQIKICMGLIEKPMGRERDTHTQGCGDIFKMTFLLFFIDFHNLHTTKQKVLSFQ